ncbi:MAG TPA: class I SAM-dependent methyltransferase [Phycisphaerales bacterium]|nr:class I SAM-dependent methyltransferase [Phycisphaerales bacterium]
MDGQGQTHRTVSGGLVPGSGPVVLDLPLGQCHPGGAGWHDEVYRAAGGDMARVPWANGRASPSLVSWLNAEAPGRVRPGSRAAVVGCGLGDDVVELINRGYDAIGFDVSPAGIDWARRRFPEQASAFCVADVLGAPTRFRHRFDLVVEVNTIQSMDPAQREAAAAAISSLLCPRGLLVAIARGREETELLEAVQGPPWPLTRTEFVGLMEAAGLKPTRAIDEFMDDERPPQKRLRGMFEHA